MNVITTLRDIEAEITRHRQEIAKHRLWISQLEDTALNLRQLAELKAADNGDASPFGTLPEGYELAVRDLPKPQLAALSAPQAVVSEKKPAKSKPKLFSEGVRARVMKTLQGEAEGMSIQEIADYLGVPRGFKPRQPIASAVYQLKHAGKLALENGRYRLA